jgi:peptide/nickel transport system substrate-binding protein
MTGKAIYLGLAACLAGLPFAVAHAQPQPGQIRVAMNSDIRSTNPGVGRDQNSDTIMQHVVEGLVAHREDGTVGPLLAESVKTSADGLTYTFALRQHIKFHNGAPLTAEDAVWSWKRYLAPATNWQCLSQFDGRGRSKIESVSAADARTVVFKLSAPNALFLTDMSTIQCGGGAILHKDSVEADGSWKAPIGTGPFTIKEWRKGQFIELARYVDYKARDGERDGYTGNKTPLVDSVRFVFIPDESITRAALIRGDVDLMPFLSIESRKDLAQRKGFTVGAAATPTMNTLLLQTRDPLLKDVRIRRALALSLDAEQLAQVVSGGTTRYNASVVAEGSSYYGSVERTGYKRDLERAKALLKEAGYANQPIKLITNRRYPDSYQSALVAQAMARQAGLNLEVEVLEWATQLERYTKGDYQAMAFPYSSRMDPAQAYDAIMGPKDTQPRKVWDNPEAQGLLKEAFVNGDKARRQALFDQLHKAMLDDVPMLMLFNSNDEFAHSDRIAGYKSWAAGKERLWGVTLAR